MILAIMETAVYLEIINKDCRALLLILIEKAFKKSQGMGHWSVGGVRLIKKNWNFGRKGFTKSQGCFEIIVSATGKYKQSPGYHHQRCQSLPGVKLIWKS